MALLDKEVIKYSRDGVVKKNLVTGKSELVTQSDYAREMKYRPVSEETQYESPHEHQKEVSKTSGPYKKKHTRAKEKRSGQNGAEKEEQESAGKTADLYPSNRKSTVYPAADSGKAPAIIKRNPSPHTNPKAGRKSRYASREKYGSSPASFKHRSGVFLRQGLKQRIYHFSKNHVLYKEKKEETDKNLGIETAQHAMRGISRFRSGVRTVQNIRRKRNTKVQTARHTAHAAKTVTKSASRILKNPEVLKFLLLAAAIFFGMLAVCMILGGLFEGLFGSTGDSAHPELTSYVAQLDEDFLSKLDDVKADYEKQSNTTVRIEGDESVATDSNVLAILATGEWTTIDLTSENKQKLKNVYKKLNTYTVSSRNETVTETKSNDDGSTSKTKKTVHHVTIQVHVHTAQEALENLVYTDRQKQDIADQISLLHEITKEMNGDAGGGNISVEEGAFAWPLPDHTYISSGYGSRTDPITGEPGAFHTGLDIPAPTGTPVLASADGTIIFSGVNGGYGNCVIIQHSNGIQTLYGHNSELKVKKGDKVIQGQIIAKVGQTGRATGPHCHFEFRVNGQHVNPAQYLQEKESN